MKKASFGTPFLLPGTRFGYCADKGAYCASLGIPGYDVISEAATLVSRLQNE
jgi:hypothetical protein